MDAFTLQVISLVLFTIGSSLVFPLMLAPHILGHEPRQWQRSGVAIGRVLASASVLFSLAAFVASKL